MLLMEHVSSRGVSLPFRCVRCESHEALVTCRVLNSRLLGTVFVG